MSEVREETYRDQVEVENVRSGTAVGRREPLTIGAHSDAVHTDDGGS